MEWSKIRKILARNRFGKTIVLYDAKKDKIPKIVPEQFIKENYSTNFESLRIDFYIYNDVVQNFVELAAILTPT
jgi:hypothetical protein